MNTVTNFTQYEVEVEDGGDNDGSNDNLKPTLFNNAKYADDVDG